MRSTRGVSMTKFESRPSKVALWEYLFFVDIEGHRDDANVAAAFAALIVAEAGKTLPPVPADLPSMSILIALYGEAAIAPRLIRRLSALDYPRDRLDALILVEADDTPTRDALAAAPLPPGRGLCDAKRPTEPHRGDTP